MSELINVDPLTSFVVASMMRYGKEGSFERKRNAAISMNDNPPTTNNNIVFLSAVPFSLNLTGPLPRSSLWWPWLKCLLEFPPIALAPLIMPERRLLGDKALLPKAEEEGALVLIGADEDEPK